MKQTTIITTPAAAPLPVIAAFLIGIAGLFINITHESLWNDEACTALLMRERIPDILRDLGNDSHPPLYFIALKGFTVLFGNNVLTLRIFSLLGLLALAGLGFGPVKRLFGKKRSGAFSLLCLYLPISVSFAQEARIYTWACFFITAMMLFGYLSIVGNRRSDWIAFTATALGAEYTHIYGLLALGIFILVSFPLIIRLRRPVLKPFLIFTGIPLVAFIPWATTMFSQIAHATSNPWYVKMQLLQAFASMGVFFADRLLIASNLPAYAVLFLAAYFFFIKGIIVSVKRREHLPLFIYAVTTGIFLAAAAISLMITPFLMPRYAFTVFGLFLLLIMHGIATLKTPRVTMIVAVALLFLTIPERIHVHANRINGPLPEVQTYLKNRLALSHVFLHNNHHTWAVFNWYFPDNPHFFIDPDTRSTRIQFPPNGIRGDDFTEFIKDKRDIWVVGTPETQEDKYVSGTAPPVPDLNKNFGYAQTEKSPLFKVMPKWYPGRKYIAFEVTPYWFQFDLSRYEKQ